ncbi:14495_t:CDS:10 [Acaulospora morrowiae]|uniref:14495_t:CDS:1 n=1 Tax=Acaulospora morrowiae TaxID=94023 RepID=A0A9N9AVP9_9GLOM|nr:14495_t:CDS:10 [Acaulospora morrowiae]
MSSKVKNPRLSSSDVEYERISRALTSLVRHFLTESLHDQSKTGGKSLLSSIESGTSRQKQTFDYCMRILGSRLTPSITSDELHVSDLIKKKLIRETKSSSKSLRFANLFAKLQSQSIVTRKWAILYFLLSVSDQSSGNEASIIANPAPIEKAFSLRGLQDIPNYKELERIRSTSDEANRFMQIAASPPKPSMKLSKEDLPPKIVLNKQLMELDNTNKEISEALLLRDIIFIFQGIDGQFVKYNVDEASYIIDPKISISRSTRDLLHRLTELGKLYLRVDKFVDNNVNDPSIGLVGQAFCSALQHELTEYYRFIAVLEAQVNKEVNGKQMSTDGISLKRLLVWIQESLLKLRMMSVLVDCCKQKRGGALVSAIYNYTNHGDPFIQQFVNNMLEKMLQRWIYEGELEDPFEEFFVACNPDVEEDLWQSKYYIRSDMRPAFISELLDKKIFSIGKSLNFIRYSCHDNNWVITNAKAAGTDKLLKYGDIMALESSIDATYNATSQQLLNILFVKYKLKEHFTALKRYLLLGQGDFIQHLMVQLGPGLSKPANTLYHHNLTGTLEAAIRASNAQYDDPDILRRLDVRLLEVTSGDVGWDVFSLDYHVDSPINTIFTPQAMHHYLKLFNFLWRLKRVEHELSSAWRRNMTSARSLFKVKELNNSNNSRLVIECSWDELVTDIHKPSGDLDSLIEAHNKYLTNITTKGFLSTSNNQDELHNFCLKEMIRRDNTSVEQNLWSIDKSKNSDPRKSLTGIQEHLSEIAGQFKGEVVNLLTSLAHHHDTDLRFLSVRLDFNEYYNHFNEKNSAHKKEPNISVKPIQVPVPCKVFLQSALIHAEATDASGCKKLLRKDTLVIRVLIYVGVVSKVCKIREDTKKQSTIEERYFTQDTKPPIMILNSMRNLVGKSFLARKTAKYLFLNVRIIEKKRISPLLRSFVTTSLPARTSLTKHQVEQEVEEIDRSQYPELFPSEEVTQEYYNEETPHNDADDAWFVDPAYENPQEESATDFVPLWQRKAAAIEDSSASNLLSISKDISHTDTDFLSIIRYLEDDGVENITLIDVRQKCDFADWIIIGEGKSVRHLGGAIDGLYRMVKEKIFLSAVTSVLPKTLIRLNYSSYQLKREVKRYNADQSNSSIKNYPIVEGRDSDDWMLIDTGSIFVHLFTPEARKYRDIEGIWETISQPISSKEELDKITKDMEREFRQFDPKLSRRPPNQD